MQKTTLFLVMSLFMGLAVSAQRSYAILFQDSVPHLDGIIEAEYWQNIPVTTDFTTSSPQFGHTPKNVTAVQMVYTPNGIFIAAQCRSTGIRAERSMRDNTGTGDYFMVGFDTWNDDQNAFVFAVTAAGQMVESRNSSTNDEINYNTRWRVKTSIQSDGWCAEMYIPFRALRFPVQSVQDWGLQFTRMDRNTGELSTWNPQSPLIKDIVLQYGLLEGLHDIQVKQRLGLSFISQFDNESSLYANIFPRIDGEQLDFAIDGQWGVNSASTFDFTILPDRSLGDRFPSTFFSSPQEFITDLPRNLTYEERNILAKNNIYEPIFSISAISVAPELAQSAIETGYPFEEFRLLQKSRFTTRTKNNIGVAISNSVMSNPNFYLYTVTPGFVETREQKLAINPIYNHIALEKALPNNSWVSFSNGLYYFHEALSVNRASMATQLRDKSNQFEITGSLNTQTQDRFTVADGNIGIQKINSAWIYGAHYYFGQKTHEGMLYSRGFFPRTLTYGLPLGQAFVGKRNFNPAHPQLLTSTHLAKIAYQKKDDPFFQNSPELIYNWIGLNRNFQECAFELSMPLRATAQVLHFGDIRLLQANHLPLGIKAVFTTDSRKKIVLPVTVAGTWDINGDQHSFKFSLAPYWVIHRSIFLQFSNHIALYENLLFPNSITGGRKSDLSDYFTNITKINLQMIPGRKWAFNIGINNQVQSTFNRKIYELDAAGNIKESSTIYAQNPKKERYFGYYGTFQWFFSRTSQLNIHWQHTFTQSRSISTLPNVIDELLVNGYQKQFKISLLWNLNKSY